MKLNEYLRILMKQYESYEYLGTLILGISFKSKLIFKNFMNIYESFWNLMNVSNLYYMNINKCLWMWSLLSLWILEFVLYCMTLYECLYESIWHLLRITALSIIALWFFFNFYELIWVFMNFL